MDKTNYKDFDPLCREDNGIDANIKEEMIY